MTAVLSEISWTEDTIMAVGLVVVMAGIPLACILGWYWFKLHQTRSENALKRSMVERGMSAADIERVMAAGSGEGEGCKPGGRRQAPIFGPSTPSVSGQRESGT